MIPESELQRIKELAFKFCCKGTDEEGYFYNEGQHDGYIAGASAEYERAQIKQSNSKWVVYSWSPDYPAYCAITCICDTEDQAKSFADQYDRIEEVTYYQTSNS